VSFMEFSVMSKALVGFVYFKSGRIDAIICDVQFRLEAVSQIIICKVLSVYSFNAKSFFVLSNPQI
jgi:hypothetical protein